MKNLRIICLFILCAASIQSADFIDERNIDFINDSQSYAFEVSQQGDSTGKIIKYNDLGSLKIPFTKDGSRLKSTITVRVYKKNNATVMEEPIYQSNYEISIDENSPTIALIAGTPFNRIAAIAFNYNWLTGFSYTQENDVDGFEMKNLGSIYNKLNKGYRLID